MPARCHADSCSIKWSEVNQLSGPAFQADVDINEASIVCGASGLEVLISGAAGNIISNAGAGLFASLPTAVVTTLSGNPENKGVAPSAAGGSEQSSDTYTWQNTSGRDALVLITGEFNFQYGVIGPSHAYSYAAGNGRKAPVVGTENLSPFNAMLAMRLLADVDAPPTTSRKACRVGIGGLVNVSVATSAEQKVERIPFFHMMRVGAGQTLNMKSQAFFQGPSQTVNVLAAPGAGTGLAGTGHELWNLQVSAVPI